MAADSDEAKSYKASDRLHKSERCRVRVETDTTFLDPE